MCFNNYLGLNEEYDTVNKTMYFDNLEEVKQYTLGEDCPGIAFYYKFNQDNADIYKRKLKEGEILDIPLEFYKIEFIGFHGSSITSKYLPFKVATIDASKRDYSNLLNRFVSDNMEQFLSDEDKVMVRSEYRKSIMNFNKIPNIQELNLKLLFL